MNHYGCMRLDIVDFPNAMAAVSLSEAALLAALAAIPGSLVIVSPMKRAATRSALNTIGGGSQGTNAPTLCGSIPAVNDSQRW